MLMCVALWRWRWIFLSILCLILICYLEHGHWVCGESWLAIKDSLTHHPSSQGWAPRVLLLFCCVLCFVVCYCVLRCGDGGGYFFLFFLLFPFGWYAIKNNYMAYVDSR